MTDCKECEGCKCPKEKTPEENQKEKGVENTEISQPMEIGEDSGD